MRATLPAPSVAGAVRSPWAKLPSSLQSTSGQVAGNGPSAQVSRNRRERYQSSTPGVPCSVAVPVGGV